MASKSAFSASPRSALAGMTLLELVMVIGLIGLLLLLVGILVIPQYIQRANDAKRKNQLEEYKIQFEAYYTDKKFYPSADIMDTKSDCGTDNLAPYLRQIYCDPQTHEPYYYQVSDDGQHYWLYANLMDETDPIITKIGCENGCGPDLNEDGARDYNYGVSNGPLEGQREAPPSGGGITDPYCPCTPGVCGTCCPGMYRCTTDSTGCYYDATCTGSN